MSASNEGCWRGNGNKTAKEEQARVETNQQRLNSVQPSPMVSWSLERDNLIKRFKLQNDRSVQMYMYVFIEGVGTPIGYYLVNKVSSVNSQLTNPEQLVYQPTEGPDYFIMPSPAEDGSYGTNGSAVFGFTPDNMYLEHNMKYICSTAPLGFKDVPNIGEITVLFKNKLKEQMDKIESEMSSGQ